MSVSTVPGTQIDAAGLVTYMNGETASRSDQFLPTSGLSNLRTTDFMTGDEVTVLIDGDGLNSTKKGEQARTVDKIEARLESLFKRLSKDGGNNQLPAFEFERGQATASGVSVQSADGLVVVTGDGGPAPAERLLSTLFGTGTSTQMLNANHVNAAVISGLAAFDKASGVVSLTDRGKQLLASIDAANVKPDPVTENSPTSLWAAVDGFSNGHDGAGARMADYLESVIPDHTGRHANGNNRIIGTHGIIELSKLEPGSEHFRNAGLNLNETQQGEVIAWARTMVQHQEIQATIQAMMTLSGGDDYNNRLLDFNEIQTWLDDHKPEDAKSVNESSPRRASFLDPNYQHADYGNINLSSNPDDVKKAIQRVLGKSWDDMSQAERNKAANVMSTGDNAPLEITSRGYGGRYAGVSGYYVGLRNGG